MERGVVVAFDKARGFGFIRSRAFAADVFVHASAVEGGGLRVGQRVEFEASATDRGPRATRVVPGSRGVTPRLASGLGLVAAMIAVAFGLRRVGLDWAWAWLAAANLATAIVYAWDKHRAVRAGRRVPEAVLLGLALAGGSPAAALVMAALHHKTRKPPFLIAFGVIALIQIALLAARFWPRSH
jgi:uncharacterized membrane protein YsdA (DUF1294 family)/cold shock CspA family protein